MKLLAKLFLGCVGIAITAVVYPTIKLGDFIYKLHKKLEEK